MKKFLSNHGVNKLEYKDKRTAWRVNNNMALHPAAKIVTACLR